jgi:hypothetical protein
MCVDTPLGFFEKKSICHETDRPSLMMIRQWIWPQIKVKVHYPMVDHTGCQKIYDTNTNHNLLKSVGTGKIGKNLEPGRVA